MVTYTDADGKTIPQKRPGGSTFSTGFRNKNRSLDYTITAQTEGDFISCKIYLAGDVVAKNTSTGERTVVTCTAHHQ
jgi:hypothetical protein